MYLTVHEYFYIFRPNKMTDDRILVGFGYDWTDDVQDDLHYYLRYVVLEL